GARDICVDIIRAEHLVEDRAFMPAVHGELAFIYKELGELSSAETECRAALALAPKSEMGSLLLFHVLLELGRRHDALAEAVRLLKLRDSSEYRALFSDVGFRSELNLAERSLAEEARALLEKALDRN